MKLTTWKNIFLWLLLLTFDTAGQVLFKAAALNFKNGIWIANYAFILAYSLELASFFIWMAIIKDKRLSISLALTSLLYITVSVASSIVFHETISISTWVGTSLIALGAFILGIQSEKQQTIL